SHSTHRVPISPLRALFVRSERSRRSGGEERNGLLHLKTAAFWTGVLFFTLRVTAHHLKEFTTFRAFELIDRHGARPPEPSIRPVASDLTLDRESLSVKPYSGLLRFSPACSPGMTVNAA